MSDQERNPQDMTARKGADSLASPTSARAKGAWCFLSAEGFARPNRLCRILVGVLCAVLVLKALAFFYRAAIVLSFPYEWSTMDGYFVYYGLRLVTGRPVYFDYGSILMPFEYVPLYPLVLGILAKIFGPAVWYERALSLACASGISILIYRAVADATENRIVALCSAVMFFAPATLSVWIIVRGMDVFAASLGLAGVFVVSKEGRRWRWRLALSVGLFVLAFYAKQTTVFPAAAAVLYVMSRRFKEGLAMGTAFGLTTAALLFVLQRVSGGWFFENAFLTTAANPFFARQLLNFLLDFSVTLFAAFPIALVQAIRGAGRRPGIWTLYFGATLVSAFLAGKFGAALTYFIPLFSAVCINMGLWLGDIRHIERRPALYSGVVGLLLVQAIVSFADRIAIPTEVDRVQAEALDSRIKAHPGPILIERIDSFAVLNERELNVEAIQLPYLILRGKFDPEVLVGSVREKEFSVIVYSGYHFGWIPALKEAIFENYQIIDRINIGLFYERTNFLVLTPR